MMPWIKSLRKKPGGKFVICAFALIIALPAQLAWSLWETTVGVFRELFRFICDVYSWD